MIYKRKWLMTDETLFSPFRLPLVVEQVEDGSYLATSPALAGFLVQADTIEEVIALAPSIAKTLVEAMQEKRTS
jgi:predicted RNase H-like HicB family nuclease